MTFVGWVTFIAAALLVIFIGGLKAKDYFDKGHVRACVLTVALVYC